MTEHEWRVSADPKAMLDAARGRATDRQYRHLMAALVGEAAGRLRDPASGKVVAALDRFAVGTLSRTELDRQLLVRFRRYPLFGVFGFPWGSDRGGGSLAGDVESAAVWVLRLSLPPEVILGGEPRVWDEARRAGPGTRVGAEMLRIAAVIRDVVGNPFRPVAFDPAWRTPKALALAEAIYQRRSFDRMAELADALERAGCDDEEVLAHCRQQGVVHARGCWLLDVVLAKA